jgi:hypothetical protein
MNAETDRDLTSEEQEQLSGGLFFVDDLPAEFTDQFRHDPADRHHKLGSPVIPLGEHRLAAYRPRHQSTSRCHHDLCVAGTKAYARGSGSQLRIASSSASHSRRAAAKSSVIALPVCPYWPVL